MNLLCCKHSEPKAITRKFASTLSRLTLVRKGSRRPSALALSMLALISSGCASLVVPSHQDIVVELLSTQGSRIASTQCQFENKRSADSFVSGAPFSIPRSSEPAKIKCIDSNGRIAAGLMTSRANVGLAGNVIFGGIIGVTVDHVSGAGFDYPPQVLLRIGQTREFDRIDSLAGVSAPGRLLSDNGEPQYKPAESQPLVKGLTLRVKEVDRVSGTPTADIRLEVSAASDTRVEFNDGSLVFYADGRAPSGAIPMPHMSGLGGRKLTLGVASTVRFLPGGEAPPVSIKITPREQLVFSEFGTTTTLLLCDVDGHGTVFGTPGGGGVAASQRIQGYIIVEPHSGLVVAANVRSENKHYSFARDFRLESGTKN